MKKILYCLMMSVIALTSCTTWDDPVTENYGDGPSISIDLQAVAPTDSAFTITLTPAAGATYYAYIIDANDEAETLDASTLIKGGYGNTVVNVSEKQTLTLPITTASPNTTYQVYAVACNDKGVVGPVANKSIKTSDAGAPYPVDADADPDAKTFYVQFSEDIAQGDGKIIVTCYKEWDITNPVELTDEEVEISVDGDVVTVVAPETPDGAFLTLSWEEGAFVDGFGNKCAAFRSYLNLNTGKWIGLYVRNTLAPFEINDTNIVSPESGKVITDYKEFEGKIEMPFEIFRNEEDEEAGNMKVLYINAGKTTIYNLTLEQWSINGKTLTFSLPVEPEDNDIITVGFDEGAITDVCGNPNAEFMAEEVSWKYSKYKATKEDILGTFNYYLTLKSNGNTYDLGAFTISEYTGEDAEPGDVVIKNLYLDDSEIYGYYDLEAQKLYIYRYQALGTYVDKNDGETYGVVTYSLGGTSTSPFDLTADGIISTDFTLAYTDAAIENLLGLELPEGTTTFVKAAASSKAQKIAKTIKSKKSSIVKKLKGSPRKVKAIRKIRK